MGQPHDLDDAAGNAWREAIQADLARLLRAEAKRLRLPDVEAAVHDLQGQRLNAPVADLLGVDVASFGDAFAATDGALELTYSDAVAGVYKKLVVTDDGRRLLGGILVGDASAYGVLRPMVASGIDLPDNPEELILPASRGGSTGSGVAALPDDAQVCSCNNVSKGAIVAAVDDAAGDPENGHACEDVACVKRCTTAGTTCGSCVGTVKAIVEDHFAKSGRTVSKALCEHFALSRAELFEVVAIHRYRTFDQIVEAHGTGRGCDVCKPAVASVLASQFNGYVLAEETSTLQDTNDAYLANIQKNGTYGVMPRVAGGEITPEEIWSVFRAEYLDELPRAQRASRVSCHTSSGTLRPRWPSPPGRRRLSSRSCPDRRPAAPAATSPASCAPAWWPAPASSAWRTPFSTGKSGASRSRPTRSSSALVETPTASVRLRVKLQSTPPRALIVPARSLITVATSELRTACSSTHSRTTFCSARSAG